MLRRLVLASMLLLSTAGCGAGCGSVDKAFRNAVDANWEVIRPEYVAYVTSDPGLTEPEKATKLRTVELFDRLLEETDE